MIPKYGIRLTGSQLNKSVISCTGEQLLILIRELSENIDSCLWYLADVSLLSPIKEWKGFESTQPKLLGGTDKLNTYVNKVDQFLSGVFLAIVSKDKIIRWSNDYETENDQFRDIESAILEIRAFDTSYFEIYSTEKRFIEKLCICFDGKIDTP